ncbi:ATP-dependent RNA helicase [Salix suchowensis]|nr:ATP-dependent RNA helicase [Salix suchowensis]
MITVRGEEARHTLRSFIDQAAEEAKIAVAASASTDQICPVCYDSATNPLVLGCAHVYCTPCMRHLLTSAEEADNFPLTCVGRGVRDSSPSHRPAVLTACGLLASARAAFMSHVTRHPQSLKYCRTPDCTQIYRATEGRAGSSCTVQCPSCFSSVCAACHEDGHEGMSCEGARVSKDRDGLSEAWIRQMKKCPTCQAPIEKAGGCNHMACRCGAHICWRCMGVFSAETIYGHMNTEHGGIHDEEVVPEHVNFEEQELVLRQAREARQRALAPPPPPPPPQIPPLAVDDVAGLQAHIRRVNEEGEQRMARAVQLRALVQQQRRLEAVREVEAEEQRLAAVRVAEAQRQRLAAAREAEARLQRPAHLDYLREAQERVNERERERRRREEGVDGGV